MEPFASVQVPVCHTPHLCWQVSINSVFEVDMCSGGLYYVIVSFGCSWADILDAVGQTFWVQLGRHFGCSWADILGAVGQTFWVQ